MIIVTGAAGFIASGLVAELNNQSFGELVLVDDFSKKEKDSNLAGKEFSQKVERNSFPEWFQNHATQIEFVFHIGARTNTTEFDQAIFDKLNVNFSKTVWNICTEHQIPLLYASSAATYGMGEFGYEDRHDIVAKLKPLNPYGKSKNEFDKWVLSQHETPPFWAGLKFFNVYGPNEYHKGRMASVIFHAFNQIQEHGFVKLFRSHHPDYKDGEQLRDFIYVKDVINVMLFMMKQHPESGLYNLGTGKARTFIDLAKATFAGMDKKPDIRFIDTPKDIRNKYQYFTEARMEKLRNQGYENRFYSLEEGVGDYVRNYLAEKKYL
jgi:ADP-L-glycero-D-manno-heptose 6-epimerase